MLCWRAGLVSFALLGVCGQGMAARMELQPEGPPPVCAIEIDFHTRHTEIDTRTLDRILRFVETSPAIERAYDKRRSGSEPATLCLVIDSPTAALAIYEQLTVLVPAQGRRLPRMKPRPAVVLRFNGG